MSPAWLALVALGAAVDGGAPPVDIELPEVVVPAPAPEPAPAPTLPPQFNTAIVPSTADARDAAQLVARAPGALLHQSGGALQAQTVSLRGAPATGTQVLLDGVALGGPGSAVDLALVPASFLERVDVSRGAVNRFGPGALGGAINLVTRRAAPTSHARLEGGYGSFSSGHLLAEASGPALGGDALVALQAAGTDGRLRYSSDALPEFAGNTPVESVRENNDAFCANLLASYARPAGEEGRVFVRARGDLYRRGLAGPIQNPTPDAREEGRHLQLVAGLNEARFFGGALATHVALRTGFQRTSPGPVARSRDEETTFGLVGAVEVQGIKGVNGLTARIDVGHDWLNTSAAMQGRLNLGLYLADEVSLLDDRLLLLASARVDQTGGFTTFSPLLGASLRLGHGVGLRFDAGQAHRPPSFYELYVRQGTVEPNASLRPERALSASASAEFSSPQVSARLGGYAVLYEDLIRYEYYPPLFARPYNFAAARVAGLEAELALSPWAFARLSANYTLALSANLRDDERYFGKPLPYQPMHVARVRAEGGPTWLGVFAELELQSEQFINRTATLALPGRAMLSAGATLTPLPSGWLRVSVLGQNLLDVRAQDFDGYPLPSRAVFVRLAVSLGDAEPGSSYEAPSS